MENSLIDKGADRCEWTTEDGTSSVRSRMKAEERAVRPRPNGQNLNSGLIGVLIIDDNRFNGAAVRRSFTALDASIPVFEVRACEEALDVLYGEHSRLSALPPCVLVLNLDMPGGLEFLKELRLSSDQSVRNATVFVHSQSNSVPDRNRAYEWNIAGYIHDRPGRKSLLGLARLLREYVRAVELPDHEESIDCRVPSRCTSDVGVETSGYVRPTSNPSYPAGATTGFELDTYHSSFDGLVHEATTRSLGHICSG